MLHNITDTNNKKMSSYPNIKNVDQDTKSVPTRVPRGTRLLQQKLLDVSEINLSSCQIQREKTEE